MIDDVAESAPGASVVDRVGRASIGDLLRSLIDDIVVLIRAEMGVAGGEIRDNLADAVGSLAAVAVGMMFLSVATLCLLGAGVAALAQYTGLVAAALIVAAFASVVAGALILIGIGRLKKVDLAPRRAVANLKRDMETLKGD